jgi:hypothetical protein
MIRAVEITWVTRILLKYSWRLSLTPLLKIVENCCLKMYNSVMLTFNNYIYHVEIILSCHLVEINWNDYLVEIIDLE